MQIRAIVLSLNKYGIVQMTDDVTELQFLVSLYEDIFDDMQLSFL
jgi:hypothetical protein